MEKIVRSWGLRKGRDKSHSLVKSLHSRSAHGAPIRRKDHNSGAFDKTVNLALAIARGQQLWWTSRVISYDTEVGFTS